MYRTHDIHDIYDIPTTEAVFMSAPFLSSFTIIFRESLEAILIVAAIYGYLNQIGEHSAKRIINYAWISAIFFGVITFLIANYLFSLTEAHAEMVEGFTSIIASIVLFYVSVWFISNSETKKWKEYIESKIYCAISSKNLTVLFMVVFFAVYREIFETILFYQTLIMQFDIDSISFGFFVGVLAVSVVAYMLFKATLLFNLRYYFIGTSIILFFLSISFLGYGIHELQETGFISLTSLESLEYKPMGLYPTYETTIPQLVLIALLGFSLYRTFLRKES